METVGEKIYNLRKEKNVSQEELAFELGVSRQTVSKWETDIVQPSMDNLKCLCDFFRVNSAYFLGESEVAAVEEIQKQAAVTEQEPLKAVRFKNTKLLILVVVSVLLALCVIACGIAAYVALLPIEGGHHVDTVDSVNYAGIIFMVIGVVASAILITLIILFIKNRRKK